MTEDFQREKILKLIKKLKLKNEEWNALGVMLLISRKEKNKHKTGNARARGKRKPH